MSNTKTQFRTTSDLIKALKIRGPESVRAVIEEVSATHGWKLAGRLGDFTPAKELLVAARDQRLHPFVCAVMRSVVDVSTIDARVCNIAARAAYETEDFELGLRILRRLMIVGSNVDREKWLQLFLARFQDPDQVVALLTVQALAADTSCALPEQTTTKLAKPLNSARGRAAPSFDAIQLSSRIRQISEASRLGPPIDRLKTALDYLNMLIGIMGGGGNTKKARKDVIGPVLQALCEMLEEACTDLALADREHLTSALSDVAVILSKAITAASGNRAFTSRLQLSSAVNFLLSGDYERCVVSSAAAYIGNGESLHYVMAFLEMRALSKLAGAAGLAVSAAEVPPPASAVGEWLEVYLSSGQVDTVLRVLDRCMIAGPDADLITKKFIDAGHLDKVAALLIGKRLNVSNAALKIVLTRTLADWRLDLCIALAPVTAKDAVTWNARNLVICSSAFLIAGEPNKARDLALMAFEREPLNAGLCRLLRGIGMEGMLQAQVAKLERMVAAGQIPIKPGGVYSLVDFLVTMENFGLAKAVLEIFILNSLADVQRQKVSPQIADASSAEAIHWLARIHEFEGNEAAALKAFGLLASIEGITQRVAGGFTRCLLEAGQLDHAHRWLLQSRPNFVVGEVPAFSAELQFIQLSQGKIGAAHDQYTTRGQVAILAKMVGEERYPLPFTPSRAHQKTLLIAEGGPGDEIRFASMYSEIEAGIEDLTVTCDPRLHTILRRSFPKIHFLPVRRYRRELYSDFVHNVFEERRRVRDPGLAMIIDDAVLDRVEEFQRVAYVMDYLPVLRRDYVDFRRLGQYLQTSPEAGSVWNERRREMFGDRVVVGLSWRSVLRSAARRRHYTEIGDWKRLFEDPRLALVCLQSRVTDDEREIVHRNGWELTIFDDVDQHNDFEATGPLMQSLDWVVAPCTTTLEFAGALGVRSILFSGSEQLTWRQLPDGSDVWHPSVTVELSHREKHSALEARSVADRVHAIIAANT